MSWTKLLQLHWFIYFWESSGSRTGCLTFKMKQMTLPMTNELLSSRSTCVLRCWLQPQALHWAVQMNLNSHSRGRHINIPHCIYSVCFLCTFPVERKKDSLGKPAKGLMRREVQDDSWRCRGDLLRTGGLWEGVTTKSLFSSFSDVPLWAHSIRNWLCLCSGLFAGSSVLACQQLGVYVCVCVCLYWINPVMLNSG